MRGKRRLATQETFTQPEQHTMEAPDVLRREIKVLAFDQYGTIVDMQKGLTDAVTPFLKRKGLGRRAERLCDLVAPLTFRKLDDRLAM
jgi:hypothetical protein